MVKKMMTAFMLELTYRNIPISSGLLVKPLLRHCRKTEDPGKKLLGRDVLFGNDALKNKQTALLYRPMAAGVAQDDEANLTAAKAFVSHL